MAEKYESVMRLAEVIWADQQQKDVRARSLAPEATEVALRDLAPRRNIVICCDGTSNEFGTQNTNVVKLFGLLKKDDPDAQIVFYDPGVGTISSSQAATWITKKISILLGYACGLGINGNILDAYRFLMNNYRGETDRLFIFGFSRGAFTARAVAGMLATVGLLPKGSENQVPYALKMYRHGEPQLQAAFKAFFSRECVPHFVGVWDTVKSVGFFTRHRFPDAESNSQIRHGRHAISLNEKRVMFRPLLFGDDPGRIEQQWFAGDHCGVGGGWPETGLSDVALKWMLEEAEKADLLLVDGWSRATQPNPAGTLHGEPWPGGVLWKLMPFCRRSVPAGAVIHPSVAERQQLDPSYQTRVGQPVRWWEWALGSVPCFLAVVALGVLGWLLLRGLAYVGPGLKWIGEHLISRPIQVYVGQPLGIQLATCVGFALLVGLALLFIRWRLGGD